MSRTLFQRFCYDAFRVVCRLGAVCVFRMRCHGREYVPAEGGVIVLSNHQSHFDPILVGLAIDRRLNFLARKSLFRSPVLRPLLELFGSIPIDREGSGFGGLKETLKRLKRGEMVLIFPEGTRTHTGEVGPLKPGFIPLARRGGAPLLPVAMAGAFEAWPRSRSLPRPARIALCFGEPIPPAQVAALDDDELLALVHERMVACHERADRCRRTTGDREPAKTGQPEN